MTRPPNWTPQEKGLLLRLAGAGKTTKEIAKQLGRTPAAVALKAKRLGIPRARGMSASTNYALALLAREPMSPAQLSVALSTSRNNVYRVVGRLREAKLIYITGWERNHSGPPVPFYTLGSSRDALRPKPQDPSHLQRKYMHRLKQERPDEYITRTKRGNARRPRKAKPDKAAAWMQHPTGE